MLTNRCAGCAKPGAELCRPCRFALIASPPVRTSSGVVAATQFSGLTKQLVVGLKYRNRRRLAAHLAEQLGRRLDPTHDRCHHVGTHQQATCPSAGLRPGRAARPGARRASWRKPCRRMLFRRTARTDGSFARAQPVARPVVLATTAASPAAGPRRRRCRHHRRHAARRPRCTPGRRRPFGGARRRRSNARRGAQVIRPRQPAASTSAMAGRGSSSTSTP